MGLTYHQWWGWVSESMPLKARASIPAFHPTLCQSPFPSNMSTLARARWTTLRASEGHRTLSRVFRSSERDPRGFLDTDGHGGAGAGAGFPSVRSSDSGDQRNICDWIRHTMLRPQSARNRTKSDRNPHVNCLESRVNAFVANLAPGLGTMKLWELLWKSRIRCQVL